MEKVAVYEVSVAMCQLDIREWLITHQMPGQPCRSNQKKAACLEASEIISELVSSVQLRDKILKETDIF